MRAQTPNPKPQTTQRFSEVDSLRAVACALVIIAHVPGPFQDVSRGGEWMIQWATTLDLGRIGVLMFFAISGFVIPSSLRGMRWEGFKTFVIRRFWRLYPPFWCVLMISVWCFPNYYERYSGKRLMWDAAMLPSLGQPEEGETWTHFWTLEVELVFYILVAGLFLAFGRLGLKVFSPAYLLASGFAMPYFLVYPISWNSLFPLLAVMFWGGICRAVLDSDISFFHFSKYKRMGRSILIGLVTSPLVSGGLLLVYKGLTMDGGGRLIGLGISLVVGVLGFLFWVVLTPIHINWLSIAGRWTYSTYLLHAIVLWGAASLARFLGGQLLGWTLPTYAAVVLVLCFAVGAVAYRWIEQPSDRIGKRLISRKSKPD